MIQRAFIHVTGPTGSGKTAFVEALLAADDGPTIVARCVRDDILRRSRESSPRSHRELQRYLQAGAYAAAAFAFPGHHLGPIEFYETQLMLNYSRAVILEGDNPIGYADLDVFVAPAPLAGETLYVRRQEDVASHRARADALQELLPQPDGMSTWMEEVVGLPIGDFVRKNPHLAEDVRSRMLASIAEVRSGPTPKPIKHWAISERFEGIQHAALVVVNVRDPAERQAAEQLLRDLARLRKDDALFSDILGWRGNRTAITAVVANVADPRDAGRKKALARVRRTIRSRTT